MTDMNDVRLGHASVAMRTKLFVVAGVLWDATTPAEVFNAFSENFFCIKWEIRGQFANTWNAFLRPLVSERKYLFSIVEAHRLFIVTIRKMRSGR